LDSINSVITEALKDKAKLIDDYYKMKKISGGVPIGSELSVFVVVKVMTDLIERAEGEVHIFERVSRITGLELIAEVKRLRALLYEELEETPVIEDSGNKWVAREIIYGTWGETWTNYEEVFDTEEEADKWVELKHNYLDWEVFKEDPDYNSPYH
jgi:hypothetical protein